MLAIGLALGTHVATFISDDTHARVCMSVSTAVVLLAYLVTWLHEPWWKK